MFFWIRALRIAIPPAFLLAALAAHADGGLEALRGQVDDPSFSQAGRVERLVLQRDLGRIVFEQGRMALAEAVEGRHFTAVFQGEGRLQLSPALLSERRQLLLHSRKDAQLDAPFKRAVLYFSDGTGAELARAMQGGDAGAGDLAGIHRGRSGKLRKRGTHWTPRILKSLLAARPGAHAFFAAEIESEDYGWLTFIFDEADPEQVELSRWDPGADIIDIWVKHPRDEQRPRDVFQDPLSHQELVLSGYDMDITIEKNTLLTAQVEATFDLRREGERLLLFAMTPDLRVESVRDGQGRELEFLQPPKDRGDDFAASYLAVASPEAFPAGKQTLHFAYSGKKVVENVGSGNFFCRSFGWYPTAGLGRPSINENPFVSRKDFEITLRVPKRYDAVAVGERVSKKREDGYQVTRWKSEIPLAVAGFAFGSYKIKTEKVDDTEIQIYANRDSDNMLRQIEIAARGARGNIGAIGLGSLSPSRMAKTMAVEVGNNLRVMEAYFGPYPYKKLAVSNIPGGYGQGWPSLLYLSTLTFLDGTQRHQLGIGDSVGITDYFRAHETSHQWWGHVVGWKSYRDQWLSEGFAQFSGNLYAWYSHSPKEYFQRMRKDKEAFLAKSREGVSYNALGPIYLGRRLSSSRARRGYQSIVYEKGGWVLHMLRMLFFDPNSKNPDERFIAMMKDFTKTHFNQPASTEDFKKVVERHMPGFMNLDGDGTMDWFFDAWVYDNAVPEYKLDYSIAPDPQAQGKFLISGQVEQSRVPEDFRMLVALYLHKDGEAMRIGFLSTRSETTSFNIPGVGFRPDELSLNHWDDILAR